MCSLIYNRFFHVFETILRTRKKEDLAPKALQICFPTETYNQIYLKTGTDVKIVRETAYFLFFMNSRIAFVSLRKAFPYLVFFIVGYTLQSKVRNT